MTCPTQLLRLAALALAATAFGVVPAYGQSTASTTPPATQDDTLRTTLGLGNAAGCLPLLRIQLITHGRLRIRSQHHRHSFTAIDRAEKRNT
jgi:hypothetical protein